MQKYKVALSDGTSKTIYWDKPKEPTDQELIDAPDYVESKPGILKRGWDAINAPLTDIGTRAGKAIGEPLLNYADSGSNTSGEIQTESLLKKAARISGAFAETFGEGVDTLSSPLNLGLAAVTGGTSLARGAIARNLPAISGAEKALFAARMAGNDVEAGRLVAELNSARKAVGQASAVEAPLRNIGRAAGATQAGIALEEGIRNKDIKQAIPFVLGALGARNHPTVLPKFSKMDIPASAGKFHGPIEAPVIHGPVEATSFEGLSHNTEVPKVNWQDPQQAGLDLQFDDPHIQGNLDLENPTPKTSMEQLFPDRYNSRSVIGPAQPEITPSLEPKQLELERPTWSKFAEQRNLPLDYDTLQAMEQTPIPEVQKAVKQLVEQEATKPPNVTFGRNTGYTKTPKSQGTISRNADDFLKSNYTVLTEDSPAGKGIANLIDKYRTETNRTAGQISATIKDAVDPLNKSQYAEFQRLLDTGSDLKTNPLTNSYSNPNVKGGSKKPINPLRPDIPEGGITNRDILSNIQPDSLGEVTDPNKFNLPHEFADAFGNESTLHQPTTDPMVQNALDVARGVDKEFTDRALQSGIHLKDSAGKLVPFTGKENYWPRMYDPILFKDKPALVEKLIRKGMSSEDATKAVNNMRRFGERLIDPQNARVLDLPEHRKDIGALLKHYDDMSHRIVSAETFGVKDIADPSSEISQLVADTKDPVRVHDILSQYLGRDNATKPYQADLVKGISKFTTALYLSKFAISNSNQLALVPVITNFKSTGKALAQFISSPKNSWREAEATGALQTVMQEALRDMGGESTISKMYGIKASEGTNRTISAIAGKFYLKDLFEKLKKNPTNTSIRRTISDLTLENPDTLLSQESLTDKQVAYGATRVVEKTQGRAQSIDLPYRWSTSPYASIVALYKKYAFVEGRLIKDALKNDPSKPFLSRGMPNINPKNAALLMALFQGTGELTGDTKAALSGLFTGDPGKAIEDRGQKSGPSSNWLVNRAIQNYNDSMFLGLIGDALQAGKSGKLSLAEFAMGPVLSLGVETVGNINADIKNPPKGFNMEQKIKRSQVLRGLASHVPYVGTAASRWMRNTNIK